MARAGQRAYVRVDGRIDTEEDFEGPDHQPLVLRRVRLEVRDGRRWRPFEDHRQVVPFTVNEGLDTIAIDTDALDAGLVVVPRESVGTAADLADRVPPGTAPETPVRARIDQLSSVEHAIVLGYPVPPIAGAGGGRRFAAARRARRPDDRGPVAPADPDRPRARRGDARPRRGRPGPDPRGRSPDRGRRGADPRVGRVGRPRRHRARPPSAGSPASTRSSRPRWPPAPSRAPSTGDPRSNGQGPGLVGTPGLAILGVAVIGILAVVATTVYVRLTASSNAARTRNEPAPGDAGGRRPDGP